MTRIYIDTNIFIGALEGPGGEANPILDFMNRLEGSPGCGVTSEITIAEFGALNRSSRRTASTLMILGVFIDFVPVSYDVLLETCDLRVMTREVGRSISLPDAIHCVTALRSGCNVLLTADKRLAVPRPLRRVSPDIEGLASLNSLLDA